MRIIHVALAGMTVIAAAPLSAQVTDTAAAVERLRQEVEAGRISPEEVQARLRAAGVTDQEVRARLREMGYPEDLLDRYLEGGLAREGAPSLTAAQLEGVLRELGLTPAEELGLEEAIPPLEEVLAEAEAPEVRSRVFGKSLFERATTQFRPVTLGPVPSNYRLGPGDELVLILTGDVQEVYNLPITREGYVVIPNVGRVSVNGLTLEQLRNTFYTYLGRVYSGVIRGPEATTYFDVTIAKLRRNQVFVIGEVEQPAAYEVTSVATALEALYQAGGPTEQGSFRNIRIRRGDREVAQLDIYEYLTAGAASGDIPLDQGDVVFVPVRGTRAEIDGNVVRPGIYELKGDEGLRELIELAGGIEPEADLRRVQIDRILPPEEREPGIFRRLFDVSVAGLLESMGATMPIEAGDKVYVYAVSEERRNTVSIRGNVWSPGVFELGPGMRLWDLIDRAGGLKDDTYLSRAQIIRLDPADLSRSVVPVSLGGAEDPVLEEYDEVVVHSIADFRDRRFVTVYGEVQNPGVYEYRENMSLRDLVMEAGGLRDNAYVLEAEVARLTARPDATGDLTELLTVPLDSSYLISESARQDAGGGAGASNGGNAASAQRADFRLERYDNVFIRRQPGWELQRTVSVTGEVRFPGRYALERKDERLAALIQRAGGVTPDAYAEGVRFFRRHEAGGGGLEFYSRVNVDLLAAMENPSEHENVILIDGDSIHVPEFSPTVRVEGAVLYPVSVMYEEGAGLDYYISSAGGYARTGDKGRTRVEYADGSVRTVSKFLLFNSKPTPEPGSRVFVPVKPEGEPINWAAVTAVITTAVTVYALLFK